MVELYIPVNLDLQKLIQDNPVTGIKGFHIDKLAYILHLQNEIPSFNKDIGSEEGFIPINAQLLRTWIGNDYHSMLKYLIEIGILETDNQFIIGQKSCGYRFSEKYQTKLKAHTVTSFVLRQKLLKQSRKQSCNDFKKLKIDGSMLDKSKGSSIVIHGGYKSVQDWYGTGLLEINHQLAHTYNSAVFLAKRNEKSKWDYTVQNGKKKYKHPYTQYVAGFRNIEKFSKQVFNCHADNNVYRQHSTLTNIKRELRNAITFNGQKMVAVDLSNSQPYLLLLLMNPGFWDGKSTNTLVASQIFSFPKYPYLPLFSTIKSFNYYITLLQNLTTQYSKGFQEFEKYKWCVTTGNFYQEFYKMVSLNEQYKSLSIAELKPVVFTTLFTDNRFIGQVEAEPKRIFRSIFPDIYSITAAIKKKSSNSLPIALQRVESFIIYQRIIPRITNERPDIPLFPIHDSIATTVGNEFYVARVMQEEIEKAVGHPCKLKMEYWEPEVLKQIINSKLQNAA